MLFYDEEKERRVIHVDRIRQGFLDRYSDRIITIDSHTQGEPTRLVVGGIGSLPGETMLEKREEFIQNHDDIRLLLTREPRGHRDMFTVVVTDPVSEEGSFGLIYMDAERYPYLCGHATIGAVTTLVEVGALHIEDGDNVVIVDTPSGSLKAHARVENGRVMSVAIDMVPSFVLETGKRVEVPGFGTLSVDLVCVGGFFAMVAANEIQIPLEADRSQVLTQLGMDIIEAANRQLDVHHPERLEVRTVDVVEFYQEDSDPGGGRSIVVYGKAHMDRSPCGTGTSAKMTLFHHKGILLAGEEYRNYSPLGTSFRGFVRETGRIGEYPAVIARIEGNSQITGFHQFVVDERDPFPRGFLL
jgi:proline racemase